MTPQALRVLLVDDQPAVVKALELLFDLNDIPYLAAATPHEAREIASREILGAVVQDMNFDRNETTGEAGIELFHSLTEIQPGLPVLLMTAWASLETAVELVREGASDYVEKPWDDEKLVATVRNLIRLRALELENEQLRNDLQQSRAELATQHDLRGLVYASQAMHRVVSLAINVARSNAPILITGPSGSGKERIAEIIQANSRRRDRPFVRVNVGAIPEELMESELFGAEPGAYTGLRNRRIGHFETAHGGTLFLDEIDALSLAGQVKLLRIAQSGEFQRLGSSKTHRVDVRILSASNASLEAAMADGTFREDLYFRLNVVELELPALAERRDDILPLARYFLTELAKETGELEAALSPAAQGALLRHDWSGNVRELENRIQRATLLAGEGQLSVENLGLAGPRGGSAPTLSGDEEAERQRLLAALTTADGVIAHAADELRLSRQALYRKMSRLGIEIERRPRG
ncbi:MAG: sigma-54 dependent transcriptional regulator [Acidobacteria bacterium]|nr:sigma-54 dependent transcriptional regulator [Acidobacteriota bacterium]